MTVTILASFASAKHGPGATTACLAMGVALARPAPARGRRLSLRRGGDKRELRSTVDRPVLIVEADPMGGDLAARLERSEGGLERLAPAARHDIDDERVLAHSEELRGGLRLLSMPLSDTAARAALAAVGTRLAEHLARSGVRALVDCGRLAAGSPALRFAELGDRVLWVTRRTIEDAAHLRARLAGLDEVAPDVVRRSSLLVLDEGDCPVEGLARAVGLRVFGTLPVDPRGVGVLHGRSGGGGADLLSEARKLARALGRGNQDTTTSDTGVTGEQPDAGGLEGVEERRA